MNTKKINLPKLSSKIIDSQNEQSSSSKNNNYPLIICTSNLEINKIIRDCMKKKAKSKYKMKIRKQFFGFHKSNKYLLNDKCNRLIIKNDNKSKRSSDITRKPSPFGISHISNLFKKEKTFYRHFTDNKIIYKENKNKKFKFNRSGNFFENNNTQIDNSKNHTAINDSEIKNDNIKTKSKKLINNDNYIKLFFSFYPNSNLRKKINKNYNKLIIKNNKTKTNKNNNNNSAELSKIKIKSNYKKIISSTNSSNSIESNNIRNNSNNIKTKIQINFNSSIRKNLFNTNSYKNNKNKNYNIKKECIEYIQSSFKVLKRQLSNSKISKIISKKNICNTKIDKGQLFNNNILNNKKKKSIEFKYEKNDLDIFIRILNIHLKIENAFIKNNVNGVICIDIENNNKITMVNKLIELINNFFEILKTIFFDIDFFVDINKNRLVRKTIKILINYYSLLLILLRQTNIEYAIRKITNSELFYQLSKILYNIFNYYIIPDLDNNDNILKIIKFFNEIIKKNNYIIKNDDNIDLFSILVKKVDICLNNLKTEIEKEINNEEYICLNPALNSILLLLININNKSVLMYIDITINVILFSILDINAINYNNIYNKRFNINNSVPYLPSMDDNYKYSLVLDMDETLIHFLYQNKSQNNILKYNMIDHDDMIQFGMFLLRPYTKYFFEKLKKLYEIIIFTNGTKEYCDSILALIDPNQEYIKFRLYRKHSINKDNDIYLKDLSLLGRDLTKIIIIDNLAKNYKLQQDNGLPITSWKGDINDTSLKDLVPILKKIVENKVEDVRKIIVNIKNKLLEKNTINYLDINDDSLFKV